MSNVESVVTAACRNEQGFIVCEYAEGASIGKHDFREELRRRRVLCDEKHSAIIKLRGLSHMSQSGQQYIGSAGYVAYTPAVAVVHSSAPLAERARALVWLIEDQVKPAFPIMSVTSEQEAIDWLESVS